MRLALLSFLGLAGFRSRQRPADDSLAAYIPKNIKRYYLDIPMLKDKAALPCRKQNGCRCILHIFVLK